MATTKYSSGTPWEPMFGYSRAVRTGPFIFVSGTTGTNKEGELVAPGDAYKQTRQAILNIEVGLQALGGNLEDVVRTRVYTTNIADYDEISKAHVEFFGNIRPASTLVEIKGLVLPEMVVEIEVDAIIDDDLPNS